MNNTIIKKCKIFALKSNDDSGCLKYTTEYIGFLNTDKEAINIHIHIVSYEKPNIGEPAAWYNEIDRRWEYGIYTVEVPFAVRIIASTDKYLDVPEVPLHIIKKFQEEQGALNTIEVEFVFNKIIE